MSAPAFVVLAFVVRYELVPGTPRPQAFRGAPPAGLSWLADDFGVVFWDGVTGVASLAAFVGLLAFGIVRRHGWTQRRWFRITTKVTLVSVLGIAVFSSYYGRKVSFRAFTHRWDAYHYLLGAKYFNEVEYQHLYDCTVEIGDTTWFPDDSKVRDLSNYMELTAAQVRQRGACKERFTPERREEFRADLQLLRSRLGKPGPFRHVVEDQGYNGTPFHTFVAGTVANAIPLNFATVNLMVLIDLFAIAVMFLVVARSFGWKTGFVFALLFATNVIDRNAATGASFLRYLWMVALTIGVCALKRKRYFSAGTWLSAAAMLNVFPLLFLLGPALKALVGMVRKRQIPRHYRRYFLGIGVATVLCGAASVSHGRGIQNYDLFMTNMAMHNQGLPTEDGQYLEKMPGYGVGLKFPFLYRGQHTKDSYFMRTRKSEQYAQIKPYVLGLGLGLVFFACGVSVRLSDLEASVLVGFTTFFCLLGTVGYYFSCAALLVLTLHARLTRPAGFLFLLALFGANAFGHWALHETDYFPVVNNVIISTSWTAWLLALFAYLGLKTGVLQRAAQLLAGPATGGATSPDERTG
jgi:hypothetical protein